MLPEPTTGGVLMEPPPPSLREAINADIFRTIGQLRPESKGGLVSTVTRINGKTSVNLAVVHRVGTHFEIAGYVGKTWGEPIVGGGTVKLEW